MNARKIPEAIQAIDQEETTWQAFHIDDSKNIISEVGRFPSDQDGPEYYVRCLNGTNQVDHLVYLADARISEIDRLDALKMRQQIDKQWCRRPKFKEKITQLWRLEKIGVVDRTGLVSGEFRDGSNEYYPSRLDVKLDGTISITQLRPAFLPNVDPANPEINIPKTRAYVLPRKVSHAFHEPHYEDNLRPIRRISIDAGTILNVMGAEIMYMLSADSSS